MRENIALLDSVGKVVVQYVYDAWGNHAVLDGNGNDIADENHIGNKNPFRYRGYYYDVETELYYLQTRYYDPEIGRFITIDGIQYLDPETINGLNLYAYCGDNPVMRTDPTGMFFLCLLIGALIGGAFTGTIKAVSTAVQGGSVRDCLGAFVGGFVTGAAVGAAFALGGALATGLVMASAATITTSIAAVGIGCFGAGVMSYWLEETVIKENPFVLNDALLRGTMTSVSGLFSLGMGAVSGVSGMWESLKPGNGLVSTIKQSALNGKTGIKAFMSGLGSYLKTNWYAMGIRNFLKGIFTSPWGLISP